MEGLYDLRPSDRARRRYQDPYNDSKPDSFSSGIAYWYSYSYSHTDAHSYAYQYPHGNANSGHHQDAQQYTNNDKLTNAHPDTYQHTHANANPSRTLEQTTCTIASRYVQWLAS